jgi:uncharacterized protein (DUF2342 family)
MAARKEQAIVDLVIDGKQAETSIKNIQKAIFETERLLRGMTKAADPAQFKKMSGELITMKGAMAGMNSELRASESGWAKFKGNIGQIALGVVGGNIFTAIGSAIVTAIPAAIQKTTELADSMADVRKSTGLAQGEVKELFKHPNAKKRIGRFGIYCR